MKQVFNTVNISQQLVSGHNLLGVLMRVVLCEEGQAIHVALLEPVFIVAEFSTPPLT